MNDCENTAKNGSPESDLHAVAWGGDVSEVRAIIEHGADVNWRDSIGESAIFGAAAWGHSSVVSYLVSVGAEVNLSEKGRGYTPLHWAASHGNLETLEILIRAGSDSAVADDFGELPIDLACRQGNAAKVAYLKTVSPQNRTHSSMDKRQE